jgi:uracil-DNA glycosylase
LDNAIALLRLQLEWGVDEAIDLDPIDRLRPVGNRPANALRPVITPGPQKGTPGERALATAVGAATIEELRLAIANFDGCALRDTATNLVFAEGNEASTTLIIGEPPGREEDRSGHPFAGAEGELLDQMLQSIGLARGDLMLTPSLPWRPPGDRPASPAEIAMCQPFLHRLVALLKPTHLVLFGATAARMVLPQPQSRRRNSRTWVESGIPGIRNPPAAVALPGLAEMLKNPPLRRDTWAGLRMLRRVLHETPTQT